MSREIARTRFAAMLSVLAVAAQEPPVHFGTTVVIPAGLRGQIYHLKRDTMRLPNFQKMKPVGAIYTTYLNVPPQPFDAGFPGVSRRYEWFAIDYSGRFWIERPGQYRFSLMSDDGSKLFIDGHLVVNNDGIHPPVDRQGAVELGPGVHQMEVQYFQGPRYDVALVLRVASPGQAMQLFRVDDFRPPPGAVVPEEPPPENGKRKRK
jgi:hypothetical protein